jgi:hypothetical protein
MIREVAAKLGVEVDATQLTSFMGTLDKAKGMLGQFATGLAVGAAVAFVKGQIEAAAKLDDTATSLGVTTDELQRFQYAVKLAGGESEGSGKALFLLNKQLGDAATAGSPAAKAFGDLGIKLKHSNGQAKTAMEILPDVADAVAKAGSHAEATAMATGLFGKQSLNLLPLLKRGKEGLKELNQEYTDLGLGLSNEFVDGAGKADEQLDRMGFATTALKSQLVLALLPALTKLLGWVVKGIAWLNHIAKTTNLLKVITIALAAVLALKMIPTIISSVRAFMALRTAVFGASVPFWLVVLAVTALALIFEDLWTMMEGGDSLIGSLLDKFGGVGTKDKVIKLFKDTWKTLVETWNDAKTSLGHLWKELGGGAGIISSLVEGFTYLVKGIAASVKGIAGLASIAKKVIDGDYAGAVAEANKTADSIFGKSQSMKSIDAAGNVKEVKENVGGLFGISDKEYQTKLVMAGLAAAPPGAAQNAANIKNDLLVQVTVPPGTDTSAVKVTTKSNADAFHAASTGVVK